MIMNILILYDSKFGNTQMVVETIKQALLLDHSVTLLQASDVTTDPIASTELNALIVASPTHNETASDPIKQALPHLQSDWPRPAD